MPGLQTKAIALVFAKAPGPLPWPHQQWVVRSMAACICHAGVAGVEAEAELLAAMVMFFQRVGLTAQDVVIKVSSRQVLQAVLEEHQVPVEATSRVFVTVDKMDKLPKETVHFCQLLMLVHMLM